jgi:DNA repair exonuclease SbcCD ATPase subunit
VLEAKLRQEQRKNSTAPIAESPDASPPTERTVEKPGISRFGSFMGKRGPAIAQQNGAAGAANTREKELEEKLVKEQTTRIAAEKKVKEVNAEIEDLSATLFQQANEMVAAERKENAALKERIQALEVQRQQKESELQARQLEEEQQHREARDEKRNEAVKKFETGSLQKENTKLKEKIKHLEQREADRKRRIERLEAANRRIERVRAMLQPP